MEIRDYEYILIPNILSKYKCSASGECCRDKWRIDIDEKSYLKTKYHLDELKEDISVYIEKNDNNNYATRFSNGYCKFITDEKLCKIHRDLGWECLSNTCKVYPRNLKLTSRGLEIGMVFSCRSAAKLLLTDEKFKIIKIKKEEFFLMTPNTISFLIPENNLESSIGLEYYKLEELLINILNFKGNLGKKLQYIYSFLDKFIFYENEELNFKELEDNYSSFTEDKFNISGLADSIVKTIIAKQNRSKSVALEFINLFRIVKLTKNLEKDREILKSDAFSFDENEINKLKESWTEKYENILNNYMLCLIFNKDFYYNISFAFMKLLMAGGLLKVRILLNIKYLGRDLTEEELLETIKAHDNDFLHDGDFFSEFYTNNNNGTELKEYTKKILTIFY